MIPVTELEMATNSTFASIVNEIQLSNLNFSIKMTPFAAYITLKKSVQKDLNGVPASPAPPLLFLLQGVQEQVLRLQVENTNLKSTVDILEKKNSAATNENIGLLKSLEDAKKDVANLTSTNHCLHVRIDETRKESARFQAEKVKHDDYIKENKKIHGVEVKELQAQIKTLKNANKTKEKENYDLKKTLENTRATMKSYKEEKSKLKTIKTRLESEIRKFEQKEKKEIHAKKIETKNKDVNGNSKKLDQDTESDSSDPSFIPTMVSHYNPHILKTFQRPASVASMIAHCSLSPPPGSSLLTMKEVMEALEKAVDKMFQSMKWPTSSSTD